MMNRSMSKTETVFKINPETTKQKAKRSIGKFEGI